MRFMLILILLFTMLELNAQYTTYITVALDGSGDYTNIQAAINETKSFPDQRITIFVKKGIYKEKVRVYPWNTNLALIGEDQDSTIITWEDHFNSINKGRNSTFHTYTLSIEADDCIIKNLSIINAAGPVGQAIALSVSGNRVAIENCRLLGNQDTLYCTGEGHMQYFKNCYIQGTTDFIFGNANALFDACIIYSLRDSYISAPSTNKNQEFGFVFLRCQLMAAAHVKKVFLARPWRAYAQCVFISCSYGNHIVQEAWHDWGKESNQKTTFFAEYAPNVDLNNRVPWSKKMKQKETKKYLPKKMFKAWKSRPNPD